MRLSPETRLGPYEIRSLLGSGGVLDPAHHTPDLIRSNANCPGPNGQPSIGFRLTMDSVTAELAGYQPGLKCVVCLR
jgi:hypothetical protein